MHRLASLGSVQITPPLTDTELARVENEFGFEFADDHRAFLAVGLPVGDRWPDWRAGTAEQLGKGLKWPIDGVLFDVMHNVLWDDGRGDPPGDSRVAM